MAAQGPNFPDSGINVDRAGNTAWSTPGNVVADDGSSASAVVPTDYLVCTDFDFSIPADATIRGVTVRIEASETGSGSSNYIPQLVSDATPTLIGSPKSAITVTTGPTISTSGSATDTWGASLTPSIVNATGFGVAIWSTDTTNTLSIDYVTVEVEYSLPTDDGDVSWWAGTHMCAVAVPIALAAATLVGAVAAQTRLHQPVDEILPWIPGAPSPTVTAASQRAQLGRTLVHWGANDEITTAEAPTVALDTDGWLPSVKARAASIFQWSVDDEIAFVPQALVEESEWTAPFLSTSRAAVSWLWSASDEIAATAVVEESEWFAPVLSVKPATVSWPQHIDDEVVPTIVEESEWSTFYSTTSTYVKQAWYADDEISSLVALASDESWQLFTPGLTKAVGLLEWNDSELFLTPPVLDEQDWQASTTLTSAKWTQIWKGDDETFFTATSVVEEDSWSAPHVVQSVRWTLAFSANDETVIPAPEIPSETTPPGTQRAVLGITILSWGGVHDELPQITAPSFSLEDDAWPVTVVSGSGSKAIPLWSASDENIPALTVEEEYWWTAERRILAPIQPAHIDDGSVVVTAPLEVVDELYDWKPQWANRQATVVWGSDDSVITTEPLEIVDESYDWRQQWIRSRTVALIWGDDGSIVVTAPPAAVPEDTSWPVAFVSGGGSKAIPLWSAGDENIPGLTVDEVYYWQAPVVVFRSARIALAWGDVEAVPEPPTPLPVDELYSWEGWTWAKAAPIISTIWWWAEGDLTVYYAPPPPPTVTRIYIIAG